MQQQKISSKNLPMDYFKAFLTVLVVLHHSILSFTYNAKAGIPIADRASFMGYDLLVGLNDNFFMFAFFFVSGFFIWKSIRKRGAGNWAGGRARRLGIPFAIGILTVNPLAYFLSALIRLRLDTPGSAPGAGELWAIFTQGIGYGYHLWFLWVLLVFSLIAVIIVRATPNPDGPIPTGRFYRSGGVFLPSFIGLALACYAPMVTLFGTSFMGIGPFYLQISRVLIYFLFFITGYLFGKRELEATLLSRESRFTKAWWAQLLAGLAAYGLIYYFYILGAIPGENIWLYYAFPILSVLAAVFLTFGLLGAFNRYIQKPNRAASSLADNAFRIYFIHYLIVTCMLYALYEVDLPGVWKGIIVFAAALPVSWLLAALWALLIKAIRKRRNTATVPETRAG